ncbi:hypothetical protein Hanom_Chr06g00552261 [Helianthus anomalus]
MTEDKSSGCEAEDKDGEVAGEIPALSPVAGKFDSALNKEQIVSPEISLLDKEGNNLEGGNFGGDWKRIFADCMRDGEGTKNLGTRFNFSEDFGESGGGANGTGLF